jgi:hypothetical protein
MAPGSENLNTECPDISAHSCTAAKPRGYRNQQMPHPPDYTKRL